MNNLETELKEEVLKDRINRFYHKNKIFIKFALLFFIIVPILIQIYFYFDYKKKENLLSEYLRAEILLNTDADKGIEILNKLQKTSNQTVLLLSTNKLLDYYLENNKLKQASNLVNNMNFNIKKNYIKELYDIKRTIINFDLIDENKILELLKINDGDTFKLLKNKLLYDYYIKNNQVQKASQIKNIK